MNFPEKMVEKNQITISANTAEANSITKLNKRRFESWIRDNRYQPTQDALPDLSFRKSLLNKKTNQQKIGTQNKTYKCSLSQKRNENFVCIGH